MNRILRQIIEVDVLGSEQAGLQIQRQVSAVCRNAQARYLEAALDACDSEERWLVVDRLDVDLGSVALADLEEVLTTALSAAVASELRARGAVGPLGASRPDRPGLSPHEALLAAVLHVLRHGRLPWWCAEAEARALEERLVVLLSAGAPGEPAAARAAFGERLAALLRSDGLARERLVRQFARSTVLRLLELMDSRLEGVVVHALRELDHPALAVARREALCAAVLETALGVVGGRAPGPGGGAFTASELIGVAVARIAPRLSADERQELLRSLGVPPAPAPDTIVRPPAQPPASDAEVVAEGLFVERAGVVLLHPFLPRFFEVLGIARGETLVRPSRALLLLHHLATGALAAEAHELVFGKLLCGLPLEAPIDREPPVSAEEQAEATALLQAVVQHWEALRSTTPDGLRGSFLVRGGRLELRGDDCLLRVEPLAHDVLLDHLPWGLGHVKLPWMGRILRVEWSP